MGAIIAGVIEALVAAFSRIMSTRIGAWIVQALLFFGIQIAANKLLVAPIKTGIASAFGGLPAEIIAWLGYLNVDRALTIIISAYATTSATRVFLTKKSTT